MKKRRCLHCKEYSLMDEMLRCNAGWFCGIEHMQEYGSKKSAKIKVKQEKESDNKRKKAFRLSDTDYQHKLTKPVFNKMRRLEELKWFADRGLEPTCISCQKPLGGDQWCCGHNKTSGGNSRLRYDRKNTYLQHNHNCNKHKSGDIEGYKKGLILRFGEDEGNSIIAYCEENRHAKKWTGEELESMRKEFNAEIKLMEKELC